MGGPSLLRDPTVTPPPAERPCLTAVDAVAIQRFEINLGELVAVYVHAAGCENCRGLLRLIELLSAHRAEALAAIMPTRLRRIECEGEGRDFPSRIQQVAWDLDAARYEARLVAALEQIAAELDQERTR